MADFAIPRRLRLTAPPDSRTTRVVLNRDALDELDLALADGLFGVALRILEVANPPDDPRTVAFSAGPKGRRYHVDDTEPAGIGKGLVENKGALAFVRGKKVNGTTIGGRQIKKTRALRISRNSGIVAIAGFGFPGRFVEFGTINATARPFLTPAVEQVVSEVPGIMRDFAGPKLPKKGGS